MPKSVCGPMRNWPSSGAPVSAIGGYQLMFIVCVDCVGVPGEEVVVEPERGGADPQQLVGERLHLREVGSRGRSSAGTSAGQTLCWNQ